MNPQSTVSIQETESWPRDFDIRVQFAEQQELLIALFPPTVDIAPPRDIPLQGKDKK